MYKKFYYTLPIKSGILKSAFADIITALIIYCAQTENNRWETDFWGG